MAYIGAGITRFNTADELTVTGDAQIDTTTLVVDSTNNRVGIGTGSPSQKLSVVESGGSARMELLSGTSGTSIIDMGDTSDADIGGIRYENTNNAMLFRANNDERLRIDSSGRVGIGTSSPSAGLHVETDVNPVARFSRGTNNTTNANWYYNTTLTGQLGAASGGFEISAVGTSTPMQFFTNGSERMRIDTSGNLLVGTTDTNPGNDSNASAGLSYNVGFGGQLIVRATANSPLMLNRTTSDGDIALFRKDGTTVGSVRSEGGDIVFGNDTRGLKFRDADVIPRDMDNTTADGVVSLGSSTSRFQDLYLSNSAQLANITNGAGEKLILNSDNMVFQVQASEAMRIDASGNVLVGKTSATFGVDGCEARPEGAIRITRNANPVAFFNRLTSDGSIVNFYKDSATVGSIGSRSGAAGIYIDSASVGGILTVGGTECYAWDTTNFYPRTDNARDLGISYLRFKDLYLSGGVYLGGTGSANHLDDYEEGNWDPEIYYQNADDQTNSTNVSQIGTYRKIGNVVVANLYLAWSTSDARAADNIGVKNFPFTSQNRNGAVKHPGQVSLAGTNLSSSDTNITLYLVNNNTLALFEQTNSGTGNLGDDFGNNPSMSIRATITYFTS